MAQLMVQLMLKPMVKQMLGLTLKPVEALARMSGRAHQL